MILGLPGDVLARASPAIHGGILSPVSTNEIRDRRPEYARIIGNGADHLHEHQTLHRRSSGLRPTRVSLVRGEQVREHPVIERNQRPQVFIVSRSDDQFEHGRRLDAAFHHETNRICSADLRGVVSARRCS